MQKINNLNLNLSQFLDFCWKCLGLHCEYDVNFLAAYNTKESSDLEISTRDELRDWKNNYSFIMLVATFVRGISSHTKVQQSDRHELPNNYCPSSGVARRIWSESRDGTVTDDNDDCQRGEKGGEFHEILLNTFRHIFFKEDLFLKY